MDNEDKTGSKGGFTVAELESRFKKYGIEITLCVAFVLTAIFSLIWGGGMLFWSIILCMVGAIVGVLFPNPIHKMLNSGLKFALKDRTTGIATCVATVLVSIFLPLIIFALLGLSAGKCCCLNGRNCCCSSDCQDDSHDHKHSAR